MTQAEEALIRLDMVHADLYKKIVLMQSQDLGDVVVSEVELACQLGLVRAAMVHLGDVRQYGAYPAAHPVLGGTHENKAPDRH